MSSLGALSGPDTLTFEARHISLLLTLALVLTACPDSSPVPLRCADLPVTDEWIELGTGEGSFESFAAEATLEGAFGGQGGFHVWTSLNGAGFHPGLGANSSIPLATAEFTIVDEDNGSSMGEGDLDDPLRYRTDGQILSPGNRTFLSQSAYDSIYGEEADFCDEFDDDDSGDDDDDDGELCGSALREYLEGRRYVFSATLTDGCGNQASDSKLIYLDL